MVRDLTPLFEPRGVVVTGVGRAMTDAVPGVLHEVQATLNGVTPR